MCVYVFVLGFFRTQSVFKLFAFVVTTFSEANIANGLNYNIHETINCNIFMLNEESNVNVNVAC